MFNRRSMIAGGLAALALGPTGAAAHLDALDTPVLPDEFMPRIVPIHLGFAAGEIHVDPARYALYWTLPDQTALRYSVGIGRPGLYEAGSFYVGAKKEWPSWTPTPEMIERDPEAYAQFADGMPGGPENPLGARALYLFTAERGDTYLRIHGTNLPRTIGTAVSNGCARLVNDQIIELYEKVPVGTRVILYPPTDALDA